MNTDKSTDRPVSLYEYDEAFWRSRFPREPYADEGASFDDYEPAYRYGSSLKDRIRDFDAEEERIREEWEKYKGTSRLDWSKARAPVKIAWFQDPEFATARPEELLNP